MSLIIRRLLVEGARRVASDPRLREKVKEGAQRARPAIERSARSVKAAVAEASPIEDPKAFAAALRRRFTQKTD